MNAIEIRKKSAWLVNKHLLWTLAIPLLHIFYIRLNQPGEQVHSLVSVIDKTIPFLPVFVIPYTFWYPFIAIALIGMLHKDAWTYFRTLLSLCLGLVVCYVTYHFFQTTVPRPVVTGTGIIPSLLRWVYTNDQPFNCFPSIHVLSSYLIIKGAGAFGTKTRITLRLIASTIIVSTLFVKQHVLLDVGAAIFLGELLYNALGIFFRQTSRVYTLNGSKERNDL